MTIGAVILCGGKSSRMGTDKSKLRLGARSFLEILRGELSGFDELLVSVAEGGGAGYVEDIYKESGPMGGIYSSLKAAKSDALLVVSCDMPLFGAALARRLAESMDRDTDALICVTKGGKIHPLCGIYLKSCLDPMKDCLEAGELKMKMLLNSVRTRYLEVGEDAYMLTNVNTPTDLEALKSGGAGCRLLPGKRNLVLLLTNRERPAVIKSYMDERDLETELSMLEKLRCTGLPVPEVKRTGPRTLEHDYLPGVTALSLFENLESGGGIFGDNDKKYCDILCKWLGEFYSVAGEEVRLNDMNLRNFIYQPERERFVGVDFESCGKGGRGRDAGALLAYILTYDPGFTDYKRAMAEYMRGALARGLGLSEGEIENECLRELEEMRLRREARGRGKDSGGAER